ncbi:MAG: triose-phosphate isomerase [Nanoarchaeota archaeon]|nr:triose-phosphate isomerase [Nanoarchaeota archaeon]
MGIVIVNYKIYEKAVGKNALKLTKALEKNAKGCNLMVAVSPLDVYNVASNTKVKVLCQHIDNVDFGKGNGKIIDKSIKDNKAKGVLINHAEDRVDIKDIKANVARCKKLKMISVVCCATLDMTKKISAFKPDYMAYELPELIGTGKSVSLLEPKIIEKFVKVVGKKSIPLCGAGVRTNEDYKAALKLGTKGVLLASGIGLAKNPGKVLKELIK